MKKLSDYKGEEAIDLWADLMEPAGRILADKEVVNAMQSGKSILSIVGKISKNHKKEVFEIISRVDDSPIDGLNVVTRFLSLIEEIMNDETAKSFFDMRGRKMADTSSGSATENIVASATSDVS